VRTLSLPIAPGGASLLCHQVRLPLERMLARAESKRDEAAAAAAAKAAKVSRNG
jgi:hypothetical protein